MRLICHFFLIFSPFLLNIEIGYSFSIFNRNGEKIFETNNPQKGWDGTYQGSHVKNGSYVYHLQYINSLGVIANKQNYIILTR